MAHRGHVLSEENIVADMTRWNARSAHVPGIVSRAIEAGEGRRCPNRCPLQAGQHPSVADGYSRYPGRMKCGRHRLKRAGLRRDQWPALVELLH